MRCNEYNPPRCKCDIAPQGLLYSHICSIVRGVVYGMPDGTHIYNAIYVDGISFILPRKPIRHVYTFSAYGGAGITKPCSNNVPEFVHDNYQCVVTVHSSTCPPITDNCSPSFHRDLRKLTSGDIEMKIRRDHDLSVKANNPSEKKVDFVGSEVSDQGQSL